MKITDYQKITELSPTSVFLVDGPSGTKTIFGRDLLKALNGVTASRDSIGTLNLSQLERASTFKSDDILLIGRDGGNVIISAEDALYAFLDEFIPSIQRRMIFRGKSLGLALTDEQKANIRNGSFKGMFIGDYWEIGGRKWIIADFDYWYKSKYTGVSSVDEHHATIIPSDPLYQASMNDENTISGGYTGSKLYKEGLDQAKVIINSAFGENNILEFYDVLSNAVSSTGFTSAWFRGKINLMTEVMVYGCNIFSEKSNTNARTLGLRQLPLFAMGAYDTSSFPSSIWLRDVCINTNPNKFCRYGIGKVAGFDSPSTNGSIVPIFGIIGKE